MAVERWYVAALGREMMAPEARMTGAEDGSCLKAADGGGNSRTMTSSHQWLEDPQCQGY